jgi:hypothetical protein
LIYEYKIFQSTMTRANSVKYLGIFLDSKLYFYNHVNFIFSRCVKLLGLVRSVTFNFSYLECMLILYFALVRSNVEYISVIWNSIISTNANKIERIEQKFANLFQSLLSSI